MNRRFFLAMACVSVLGAVFARPAPAATGLDAATIKAALRTATPEEEGFVSRVVDLTNQGVLPADLVDSTLQWARNKSHHRFQYFKRALILRASRLGIQI